MKVVYIAGPFRGPSAWAIEENIRRAERLALEVWLLGAAALCPHTNTRFFQGAAADDLWLRGDLAMLRRCDAVLVTPDWELSAGARAEVRVARAHAIPVLKSTAALRDWLKGVSTHVKAKESRARRPALLRDDGAVLGTPSTGAGAGDHQAPPAAAASAGEGEAGADQEPQGRRPGRGVDTAGVLT
jgi:hypothetical protein